jgi:hypothetical protein
VTHLFLCCRIILVGVLTRNVSSWISLLGKSRSFTSRKVTHTPMRFNGFFDSREGPCNPQSIRFLFSGILVRWIKLLINLDIPFAWLVNLILEPSPTFCYGAPHISFDSYLRCVILNSDSCNLVHLYSNTIWVLGYFIVDGKRAKAVALVVWYL